MGRAKNGGAAVSKSDTVERAPIKISCGEVELRPVGEIIPYARNAKVHGPEQIRRIRASLREFGFVRPLLIDAAGNLIAGHGTLEAAMAEGMESVPCVLAEGLTESQRKAYILADNKLSELSSWDEAMLGLELQELGEMGLDLDIAGFDPGTLASVDVEAYTRSKPGQSEVPFAPFDGAGDGGGSQIANGTKFRVVMGPIIIDLEDGDHTLYDLAKGASAEVLTEMLPGALRTLLEDSQS